MSTPNLTRGQIERNLTQKIQAFYLEQLGKRPERVTCQFFDEKLAIVIEKVVTPSEKLLIENGSQDFAQKLRIQLDTYIKPQLIELIEEIVGTGIITLLVNSDLKIDVSGIIAVLKNPPIVRDPETIPKAKKDKTTSTGNA